MAGFPKNALSISFFCVIHHGIVLGLSCTPMERIQLEVLFGLKDNHHRELI
jgi:hypothetical protein